VAEGARLESVYTGNRIVGSNPTPSARFFSGTPSPAARNGGKLLAEFSFVLKDGRPIVGALRAYLTTDLWASARTLAGFSSGLSATFE
jgi:hypothetical protein